MAPSIPELILLLLIILCVFGLGRLGAISEAIGERHARRVSGPGRRVVDLGAARGPQKSGLPGGDAAGTPDKGADNDPTETPPEP